MELLRKIRKRSSIFKNQILIPFRSLKPFSRRFGMGRGQPIDRYYIDKFFTENQRYITGKVLEVGHDTYTRQFGHDVAYSYVLNKDVLNKVQKVAEDLTDTSTLPKEKFDCIIATQTLNFIYEFSKAIDGLAYLLASNGVVLITVASISQISRFDMDRWGDYWRFTTQSIEKIFGERQFVVEHLEVYGNSLVAASFIRGMSAQELSRKQLDYKDAEYPLTICCVVRKKV
jgi:hypothetical protein